MTGVELEGEVRVSDLELESGGVRLHARCWRPVAPEGSEAAEVTEAPGDPAAGAPLADRTPLVLLHGFMQDARAWDDVAPVLAQDRPVFALDFAGFGASARPQDDASYRLEALAASAADLVEAVAPDRRAHVLGYSMGGRVALALAASRPELVAALVLEGAGLGPRDAEERAIAVERDEAWARRLTAGTMEEFVAYWESLPLFASQTTMPEERQAAMRAMRRSCAPEVLARALRGAGQHAMPYLGDALCGFPMPICYLAGQRDRKYTKVALHLAATTGATVTLLSCGHNAHVEQPESFCEHVRAYLARLAV